MKKTTAFWFVGIVFYFALWWLWMWPGQFSWDTLAYMTVAQHGTTLVSKIDTVHSLLYSLIINLFYPTGYYSPLAAIQLLFAALVLARLYALLWAMQPSKPVKAWAWLAFLSPITAIMVLYLGGDSFYTFAMIGLLFECWLIAWRRKSSASSWLLILLYTPFAFFTRANGMIFIVLIPLLTWSIYRRSDWIKLTACLFGWFILGIVLGSQVPGPRHPILFPVVIQELVSFAQPRPERPAGVRLSEQSAEFFKQRGIDLNELAPFYHPYYWDYVGFFPLGPRLLSKLSEDEHRELVRIFLMHDLWKNLPSYLGHRVDVFLAMALAKEKDHLPDPRERFTPLKIMNTTIADRTESLLPDSVGRVFEKIYRFSFRWRWLFWGSLPGIVLLCVLFFKQGWRCPEKRIVTVPLLVQVVGLFCLAPAAQYRYLFPCFMSVPLLLLVYSAGKKATPAVTTPSTTS